MKIYVSLLTTKVEEMSYLSSAAKVPTISTSSSIRLNDNKLDEKLEELWRNRPFQTRRQAKRGQWSRTAKQRRRDLSVSQRGRDTYEARDRWERRNPLTASGPCDLNDVIRHEAKRKAKLRRGELVR